MKPAEMDLLWEQDGARITAQATPGAGRNIVYAVRLSAQLLDNSLQGPQRLFLTAEFLPARSHVHLEDMNGNGYTSGLQGIGTGTLLMNTLIQMLTANHPPDTLLFGQPSSAGDPYNRLIAQRCHANRMRFWEGYGLRPQAGHDVPAILGRLSDARIQRADRLIRDRIPTFIPLSAFRRNRL